MTCPSIVRVATPDDYQECWRLFLQGHRENGLFTLSPDNWLAGQGVAAGEVFALVGFLNTERDGEYQIQLRHAMQAAVLVDDRPLYEAKNASTVVDYIPVALKAGLHKIEIRGRATEDLRLDVRFGYSGMHPLRPASMTHIPLPQ